MKAHQAEKDRTKSKRRTRHIDRLPEPARSIGHDVLAQGLDTKSATEAEALAAHHAEEWIASRAPMAHAVREHVPLVAPEPEDEPPPKRGG